MTESPKYMVIKRNGEIELRQYAGMIQAEVQIDGRDYKAAIENGFGVLAGYIFGSNITRQKIDMTTPVQVSQSEKIAMTTPVTVRGSGRYTVAFVMPAEYTLETLPQPKDSRVRFKVIPTHFMAAIRFSGYFQQRAIDKNTELLRQWLDQERLEPEGDFIVAGYNPPWVPGFLARNEVMIQIKWVG